MIYSKLMRGADDTGNHMDEIYKALQLDHLEMAAANVLRLRISRLCAYYGYVHITVMCIPQICAYHDKRPPAVSMMLLGEEPLTIGILFRKIVEENDSTAGYAENVRWCFI